MHSQRQLGPQRQLLLGSRKSEEALTPMDDGDELGLCGEGRVRSKSSNDEKLLRLRDTSTARRVARKA